MRNLGAVFKNGDAYSLRASIANAQPLCACGAIRAHNATVITPLAPSYVTSADADSSDHFFARVDKQKRRRHAAQCKAAGMDYYSLILTVYGGMRGAFFDNIVQPHYSERFARTRGGLSDETVWEVAADKQRFLTRWSVALARANAQLLTRAVTAEPHSPPPSPERMRTMIRERMNGGAAIRKGRTRTRR